MIKYIVRRIIWFVPVLLAIALATFSMGRALPGGPFDIARGTDKALPPQVVANLEAKYGLDKPAYYQFARYVFNAARGDFGPSYYYRNLTVTDIVRQGLPISFQLGILAMLLALMIGIPAGIVAALRQNSWLDYAATFVAIAGISMPAFVIGPILQWVFAIKLSWLPVARWEGPSYWVLPTLALGTGISGAIARLTRASLLQVIREDYIRTARAKGLAEHVVVVRHALKNSLIPVVTILGPLFAAVVTGTFVVETIFAVPGLGRHFITSIGNRDYPVILGTTLLYSIFLVVANLVVDIAYAWLDPRIRYD